MLGELNECVGETQHSVLIGCSYMLLELICETSERCYSLLFPESLSLVSLPKIIRMLPLDAPLPLAKQDIW